MYVYFLLAHHISLVPAAVLVVPHVPIVYLYCQLSTCPSPECLISVWAVCMGPGDTARTSVVYSVQCTVRCRVYSGHHGTTLTWSQLEMSRRAVTSLCELQYVIL